MRWGISGEPVSETLLYAVPINDAGIKQGFPPTLAYSIAWIESIQGEVNGKWNAATVQSADGGWGLFQLTSFHPDNWQDPYVNAHFAIQDWLLPDAIYWFRHYEYTGNDLIRCVAASFNAGLNGALKGHAEGDVGKYTTDRYPDRALAVYEKLVATGKP
jgi:hypothetical protein